MLLDFGGIARLSDFGMSRFAVSLQNASFYTSFCGGAMRWAAPEFYRFSSTGDKPITPSEETDVYSFGSIVFQARFIFRAQSIIVQLTVFLLYSRFYREMSRTIT